MSATLIQREKKQSALDGFHEMTKDYDYKTAIIDEIRLETLQREANKANLNLNSASEQMFRVSPECLNNEQATQLFQMLFEAAVKLVKPRHRHYCVECGGII